LCLGPMTCLKKLAMFCRMYFCFKPDKMIILTTVHIAVENDALINSQTYIQRHKRARAHRHTHRHTYTHTHSTLK
jgi:hypothetical protein